MCMSFSLLYIFKYCSFQISVYNVAEKYTAFLLPVLNLKYCRHEKKKTKNEFRSIEHAHLFKGAVCKFCIDL